MDKTLKILALGVAIAAGVAGVGAIANYVGAARHEQRIASLQNKIAALRSRCVAEGGAEGGIYSKSGSGWEQDQPLCDPQLLATDSESLIGIQREISVEQLKFNIENRYRPLGIFYLASICIFVIAMIPWSWYFLLRRIREMSNAIRGR